MADEKLVVDVAKLLIAAAWADGQLQNEEINCLKDLIFSLGDLSADQWTRLEIYMDSPVTSKERQVLLEKVLAGIKSEADKEFVIETVKRLFEADGVFDEKEASVLEELTEAVSEVSTDIVSKLTKTLKSAMGRRSETYKSAAQREERIEDFIKNTIYYQLASEGGLQVGLTDEKIRQLCLAAGLLARVANVDEDISEAERQAIKSVLSRSWGLSDQEADIVTGISCHRTLKGLDYFRLARGFFECTSIEQRRSFLVCLFKVANASDKVSNEEIEQIRRIADSLKLSHRDFIAAKLTISDEDLGLT